MKSLPLGWLLFVLLSTAIYADEPAPLDDDPLGHTILSPAESLKALALPEGFQATLFSAEPQVRQPIAMAMDPRGRVWVVENNTYANGQVGFDRRQNDRVVILEDTDGDGKADKRTVFVDGLKLATSVEIGNGGVWVLAPPQLLFYPDQNHDDVPDGPPTVILDGFDAGPVRHNIANGLRWGPDGWLYGRHGILATSFLGTPKSVREDRTAINCGVWRYHPQTQHVEAVAHGTTNPWGHDWDEHGQLFLINTVIGHLWHVVPGSHFQRMYGDDFNPHLYQLLPQTADHVHWDTAHESWTDVRKNGVTTITTATDRFGGGHAHCGLMIYLGDNWPDKYRGRVLTVNLHGHRLNADRLDRTAIGYVGKHEGDLLQFGDPGFRGVELLYGPDGGVLIADWSDVGECHENDGVHRSSGRIFKVTAGQPQAITGLNLYQKSLAELAEMAVSGSEWMARQSRRVLADRTFAGEDVAAVRQQLMARTETKTVPRLRVLWALQALGGPEPAALVPLLADADEHVAVWSLLLLTDHWQSWQSTAAGSFREAVIQAIQKRAAQPPTGKSDLVPLYLASVLQRMPLTERWPIATALVNRADVAADLQTTLLLWTALEPAVVADAEQARVFLDHCPVAQLQENLARRFTHDLDQRRDTVGKMAQWAAERLSKKQPGATPILNGMTIALQGRRKAKPPAEWEAAHAVFSAGGDAREQELARGLAVVFGDGRALDEVRVMALKGGKDAATRRAAVRSLVDARPDDLAPSLQKILFDRDVAVEAVRGLGTVDHPETAQLLVDQFNRLPTVAAKEEAISTLCSRVSFAKTFVQGVREGKIGRDQATAFQVRQLRYLFDETVNAALPELWPEVKQLAADRAELTQRLRTLLTPDHVAAADVPKGRKLFEDSCAKCHKLYGQGGAIGPDLTGAQRFNLNYLLENIIDPSATVAVQFRASVLRLEDGRVLTGVIGERTATRLTVQTATEKIPLRRADVEEIRETELSLMPDGQLSRLTNEQISDLFAYLMTKEQPK